MPGNRIRIAAGLRRRAALAIPAHCTLGGVPWATRLLPVLPAIALVPGPAAAQSANSGGDAAASLVLFSPTEIMLLAVFGGAMSFAIMAAFWLIRERSRITGENTEMRERLASLRASHDRANALAASDDQRIVVWNGLDETPAVLGRLSGECGAPADVIEFLAFGRWLEARSALSFEHGLKRLRLAAEPFDMPLETIAGGVVEAQGRTSGGHAFVRFRDLAGARLELSRLEAEHSRLSGESATVRAMFEVLPMPVWLRNAIGELSWVNPAYARAVDRTDPVDAVRDGVSLFDSTERSEVARRQRESGVFLGALPAIVAGDRRLLDIAEVRTDDGAAGIAVDRSETERVRETLKRTVAGHAQTLDHLATAIAIFDAHETLQFHNSAFQQLWGLDEAFLQSGPSNAQLFEALRAAGKLPESPDWRRWRDQQREIYRALEARQELWHLPDGQTLRVVASPSPQGGVTWVFENVTEQVELQSNINTLVQVQSETLKHLNEAVAVFGSDGRLRLCNPAFAHVWGLDDEGGRLARARPHVRQIADACRGRLADDAPWKEILSGVTGFDEMRRDLSGRIETVDGRVYDYTLVRLPEGQSMLAMVDMTAAVNVERALKERNEALEASDGLKNRFIQHVSYELRAPLTSIAGFAELASMPGTGALNEKQAEYVEYIASSAQVLKELIDDMLDLATIDAGAMTLDLERFDLEQALHAAAAEFKPQLGERGLSLAFAISPSASVIMADRQRTAQIARNLLANAVRFSPDGGRILVEARADGAMCEIAVSDEGPQVPADLKRRIFERFEGRTAKGARRGAGLGLAVVRSFAELHGGSVRVEDAQAQGRAERGARFVCLLPLRTRLADAAE
jgi:signal transduction histidine kinase